MCCKKFRWGDRLNRGQLSNSMVPAIRLAEARSLAHRFGFKMLQHRLWPRHVGRRSRRGTEEMEVGERKVFNFV